jgi:hypothetical protein
MREQGKRVRAEFVSVPVYGWLLATQPGPDIWHLGLYHEDVWTERFGLAFAQLLREGGDGTRLYQGEERDLSNPEARWKQTWLCTPTRQAANLILENMAQQQW